jgi:hypothetical protein
LLDSGKTNYVYVVKPGHIVEKRRVSLLVYSNLNVSEDNISDGEAVVNNPPRI